MLYELLDEILHVETTNHVGYCPVNLVNVCKLKLSYTVQYSTVKYSAVQYITVQYSTVHHRTVQHRTAQYITV